MSEEDHKKIGSYEDAFEKIKEETGVNSMQVSVEEEDVMEAFPSMNINLFFQ